MRHDGRRPNQLRPLSMKINVNPFAEGSCIVKVGSTHVLCTASVENGVPRFLKDSGKGWVTAEYGMLPRSCQKRIPRDSSKGRVNGRSQEIQRLVGRSLRTVTNLNALGERTVWIDCDVLQGDGGTRCAAISGAYVALKQATDKLVKDGVISKSPIKGQLAAVSVGVCEGTPVLDLDYKEDSSAEVDMNIVMTDAGQFVELQGTAEKTPFSERQMKRLVALAKSGIRSIFLAQKKVLKK